MNCECFYVPKDQTMSGARKLAKTINKMAVKYAEEVYPNSIARVNETITAAFDYDGMSEHFIVPAGTLIVFAGGKNYCMDRILPKNAIKAFPYPIERYEEKDLFTDLETCHSWLDDLYDEYLKEKSDDNL